MKLTHRSLLPLVLCASACKSTVDTSTTLSQIVDSRHEAAVHVRERGEPRGLVRIGQQTFGAADLLADWYDVAYTDFGALPALAFDGDDVLVMTGDVVVGGTRNTPEVVQLSRLWRVARDGGREKLFETKDVILGGFVPLDEGYCLALRFDANESEGRHIGTALLRLEDGSMGNLTLTGFERASVLLVDPADDTPVLLGERRSGDEHEWGLFRLEGVDRRPKLFESRVVAPAFSVDGRRFAYAWHSDREAARSGRELDDGPHERLTVVDRETGAGRHLDTGIDVVATAFDPRDVFRLYALGSEDGEWQLLAVELEGNHLEVTSRQPFPPRSSEPDWRKRLDD
ncbi:MAG: hypothetical protein H6831_03080 [Planctomycetes bacterium]|nr:hypothetical protein [Planctomycetota bacterium]MCB9903367.1 hypothetical protein [Planctomycetota bacterium]